MNSMTIAEQLEQDGYVLTLSVGVSMRPMLTQRTEQLVIEKLSTSPAINDVVLFQRSSGQYVLHRVVGRRQGIYLIRGDNCYDRERVHPSQIIGILKGFYKGDKYVCCASNGGYLCYVAFWRLTFPIRYLLRKLKHCVYAVISKFRRSKV